MSAMSLLSWLHDRDGIGHRHDAADAGFTPSHVRAAIRAGAVLRIRARWIALPGASPELAAAASAGGALTCVSLARRRGWWVPPEADGLLHLHLPAHGSVSADGVRAHWSKPLTPINRRLLEASVEDALADAAQCFPFDQAVAIWESAVRAEAISLESLRTVRWCSTTARRCANEVRADMGSSLETVFRVRLSPWGVRLRYQVQLAGHPVDFLIGTHLVIQIDGWGFHASSADRTRDVRHDAELRMRGYTVLRFSYAQVIYRWWEAERIIAEAVSRGLHLAPAVA